MFGGNGEQRLTETLQNLNFKELYLMGGNHQAGYKQLLSKSYNDNGVHYLLFGDKRVYFIPNYFEIIICGQSIALSHYPIASWNGQSKGSWMIHGHCHSNLYNSELGKILYRCKIIDVGIENCLNPISFSDVRNSFNVKENLTFDHHNSETKNPF
jgi:calcineurin-like phosphoesterase family protein